MILREETLHCEWCAQVKGLTDPSRVPYGSSVSIKLAVFYACFQVYAVGSPAKITQDRMIDSAFKK